MKRFTPLQRRVLRTCALALGCGPAVGVEQTDGGGSGDGDTTHVETSGDGASATASEGGASSSVDSSGSLPAACGDAIVDASEACDDGNDDELDGCDSQCRVTGIELWDLLLPPSSLCPRLAALDDGGVAIIGNERFEPNASIPHVLVIESDGALRWSSQGGHWAFDEATDVLADPNGFVVVGRGEESNAFAGWMQLWAADGSVTTEVMLGTTELGDLISDIERRDDASYWTVARSDATDPEALFFRGFDAPPSSATPLLADAFDVQIARGPDEGVYVTADAELGTITRVDRDGAVNWTMPYAASGAATAFTLSLASTSSGDAIVAGTDQGEPDAQWIRSFAPDGVERWRVPVEVSASPSDDEPLHLAVSDAAAIYVAGWSRMAGGNDGFLAKYDAEGTEVWQSIWTGQGELNVRPCDVVTTSEGAIVVAGYDFLAGEEPAAYWLRAYAE